MTTILTRASKGSALTNTEMDDNLTALNAGKIEVSLLAVALGVATLNASGYLLTAQIPPTLNAATVTTNANMTGPITGTGNVTSITAQTGTGTTFAMSVSPTFTGVPAAPTAAVDTSTTQLATTAFVTAQAASASPLINGSVSVGTSLRYARADHVHPTDTTRAPTASPTFTGTATFNIISATGQINSTLATGTAPLVIASTTQVANLNVSFLEAKTWAVPGTIGSTTPNTGAFTSLSASAAATFGAAVVVNGRIAVMTSVGAANMGVLIEPSASSVTPLTGVTQFGSYANVTGTTAGTTAVYGHASRVSSTASAYTMALGGAYVAFDGTKGAGSNYTEQDGFYCTDLTVAATNIGFRSSVSAGVTKWNFYADGTAQNYFSGNVGIGVVQPGYPIDLISATADYIGIRIRGGFGTDVGGVQFASYAGVVQGRILGGPSGYISFATGNPLVTQVQVVHLASVVNSLTLTGAIAGGDPIVGSLGPSGDIGLKLTCKGTGKVTITSHSGAQTQFRVRGDNVAVNYLDVFGTTTGNGPIIRAEGADSNIRLNLYSKGTESVAIGTNQGASVGALVAYIASAVNYLVLSPSAAGGTPSLYVGGSDTDIALSIASKGADGINFVANGATQVYINPQASSVNYILASGNTAGNKPYLLMAGSDSNIGFQIAAKGTGSINFATASSVVQFQINDTASATRYITVTGANGGSPTIGTSAGSIYFSTGVVNSHVTLTYSASITIAADTGNSFVVTATNGTAFTINAPTGGITGQIILVTIRNTSGGALGVATWNAVFKMVAWVQPATAFSRSILFRYDGANWVEMMRGAADVAN